MPGSHKCCFGADFRPVPEHAPDPPVPSSVTSPAGRHYDLPVFSYQGSDLK